MSGSMHLKGSDHHFPGAERSWDMVVCGACCRCRMIVVRLLVLDRNIRGQWWMFLHSSQYSRAYFHFSDWRVQRQNEIKALAEMGHPLTSCVVVEWGLRGGHVSRCEKRLCVCVCLHVLSGGPGGICVYVWACVLECGLTFNSDTTSDIRLPHREFTIFSHHSTKPH